MVVYVDFAITRVNLSSLLENALRQHIIYWSKNLGIYFLN